ncbi:hypothetical protein ACX27_26695 [Nostoc piscinale CENA21]|uniref:LysM domain-containing protein n=1 Tax=Nostoc piscinale CENA21 TaxID=224013 RepID=A0A0M3V6K9_9NOSO|nr:LysM peptidoglycan-binding domain-containing protein [Nostoc piscinale]ALF55617.1 hypothetical protein ACX27_26695 [Nostoc piscinale CENA21]
MSTVPLKQGDTLVKLANDILDDYRAWREFAQINKIDIFDDLPIGENIRIPDREELKKILDEEQARVIASTEKDVKARLTQIAADREVQSIAKVLGVDTTKLIEDLDLKSIAEANLPRLSNNVDQVWQLISWIA